MRLLILFVFVLVSSGFKSDPAAKKLMDKVDQYYKSIGGFEILFSYEIDSEKEKIKGQSGSLSARGDKFKLVLSEFELYCNGKSQYTYLKKIMRFRLPVLMIQTTSSDRNPSLLFTNPENSSTG